MSIHIMNSDQGDWVGLYRDGILLREGHSLEIAQVLSALDIEYTQDYRDLEEYGFRCPRELS